MTAWSKVFEIDFRSLRLFRFGLGLFILADLGIRSFNFRAFHLDDGALPAQLLHRKWESLFLWSNSPYWAAMLFVIYAVCGALMMTGWRPRTLSVVCWILAMSLKNRNPMVMYGADDLFRLGLIWSALLPSGPRHEGEKAVSGIIPACALGQIFALYFAAGLNKSYDEWFANPIATFVALSSDTYAKPITRLFLDYPTLLAWSAISVFIIERAGWLLIFSPWRTAYCRAAAFVLFAGMHLTFGMFLHLELFPMMDIVMLTLLLPRELWDWLKVHDTVTVQPVPRLEPLMKGFAVILLTALLYVNISYLPQVQAEVLRPVRKVMRAFGIYQSWSMFTPIAGLSDGYYRVISQTPDGLMADEMNQKVIDGFPFKPVDAQLEQGGFRWTRLLEDMNVKKDPEYFKGLLQYFCRQWTPPGEHSRSREISLLFFHETTVVPGIPVVAMLHTLASETCGK